MQRTNKTKLHNIYWQKENSKKIPRNKPHNANGKNINDGKHLKGRRLEKA